MAQFISNEKINNKFDIPRFIQSDVSTASCSHYQVLSYNAYNFKSFYTDFNKLNIINKTKDTYLLLNKNNSTEAVFLFKLSVSLLISKLSLISKER